MQCKIWDSKRIQFKVGSNILGTRIDFGPSWFLHVGAIEQNAVTPPNKPIRMLHKQINLRLVNQMTTTSVPIAWTKDSEQPLVAGISTHGDNVIKHH